MPTIPYLHFQGDCADALAFYAEVFGGTGLTTMRYADNPQPHAGWAGSDRVMHGEVHFQGGTLMGSDFPPGFEGDPQKAVSVMQTLPDVATARAAFDRLAEGGGVIDDFKATFFSPGFGMVKDRFGTHWIISAMPSAGASTGAPAGSPAA